MDALDAKSEEMCRGQPVAQEAPVAEAEEDEEPSQAAEGTAEAASEMQPAVSSSEGMETADPPGDEARAEAPEVDAKNASSSSSSALPGTEAKEPKVPSSEAAVCTVEAEKDEGKKAGCEDAEEATQKSIKDPDAPEAEEKEKAPSNEAGPSSVGELAAGDDVNVEAGEEDEEALEISISEDPLEAAPKQPKASEEDDEELLFTIDAAGESLQLDAAAPEVAAEDVEQKEAVKNDKERQPEAGEKTEKEVVGKEVGDSETIEATCATCGLFGHDASGCPFAHPEDIDLGDLEESDSDDELAELYPLFSRYVQQHIGALTPKDRKGLTGGGRYFGQEKQQACWACAEVGHDANDCPDKGCFFCSKKGHESRDCPQRALRCSHCNLRGHAPVSCPTLATLRLADFTNVRCMRCGTLGHPNCGVPPRAPDAAAQAVPSAREEADKQLLLQQIAAGRARTRAWDTAPWRAKPDLELPNAKVAKVTKVDVPAPDLRLED